MVKKIDFHIHTISSLIDYEFIFSPDWLKRYVKEADLDAIAITNHNLFNEENFRLIQNTLSNTAVFPGIELSLENGHVNIIFSEDDVENLVNFSRWIETNGLSDKSIKPIDLCNNMTGWENGIYVFEMGKSKSLKVPPEFNKVCKVGGVSNQLRFQANIKRKNELTPVLFSDAHATDNDNEKSRNDIDLLKEKITFIQSDTCDFNEIRRTIDQISKVGVNKENIKDIVTINNNQVSTGLNLIVGKRGTGKTYFIDQIKDYFDPEDVYHIQQFETSNAKKYIEKNRSEYGQKAFNNWKSTFETQFNTIQDYMDGYKNGINDNIDEYLSSVKKFANDTVTSKSASKFHLYKESNFEDIPLDNLNNHLKNLLKIIKSEEIWDTIRESTFRKKIFIDTYNELRNEYLNRKIKNSIQQSVNDILQTVKDYIESVTGISQVVDSNFSNIIQGIQKEKEIQHFLENLIFEKELSKQNLYGYQIVIRIAPFESATQFKNKHSIKEAVNDEIIKPYLQKDYISFIRNLKKRRFFNPSNLPEYFLDTKVDLLDSFGVPASGGQAVGFALMMRLDEAKTKQVILIDEPEASLDNEYIRNDLTKAIKSLVPKSTVFLVTHNSTLGSLINPDYLIVTNRITEKEYQVLTGSFSSNKITNNLGETEDSFNKFLEAMESGIKNYQLKGKVYENLRN